MTVHIKAITRPDKGPTDFDVPDSYLEAENEKKPRVEEINRHRGPNWKCLLVPSRPVACDTRDSHLGGLLLLVLAGDFFGFRILGRLGLKELMVVVSAVRLVIAA